MTRLVSRFLQDRSGATAIEYGLIASLVAIVIIAGLTSLGSNLGASFNSVSTNVSSAK